MNVRALRFVHFLNDFYDYREELIERAVRVRSQTAGASHRLMEALRANDEANFPEIVFHPFTRYAVHDLDDCRKVELKRAIEVAVETACSLRVAVDTGRADPLADCLPVLMHGRHGTLTSGRRRAVHYREPSL